MAYEDDLIATYGADEVWALTDIASGTTIHASNNANRNGTLTGWDLQNAAGPTGSDSAPYSPGANDYGDIYTSNGTDGIDDIFDMDTGSMFIWIKANAAAMWTDSTLRFIFYLYVDAQNRCAIYRPSANNQLGFIYEAGNTQKTVTPTYSGTGWTSLGLSWSTAADEVRAFINGSQVGTTQTALGTPNNSTLSNSQTVLGSLNTSATNVWHGWLAYAAVKFGAVWTPTDFSNMHNAATAGGGLSIPVAMATYRRRRV